MTKKVYIIISLLLCFVLLAGCTGAAEPSSGPEAAVSVPEPPSTMPDPTAVPEKNGMYDLLTGVFDSYHFGTAGSSLTAAWYAASITDWGMENGGAAVVSGARAWDRGLETEYGESFSEKLDSIFAAALSLYGAGTGVLSDCGWEGEWTWSARDVRSVFEPIYPALGLDTPLTVRVYYPDSEVMYLCAQGMVLDRGLEADIPELLNSALSGYVFREGAAIAGAGMENDTLTLELNDALASQIRSYGTSGEMLTVAAVVNTALDAVREAESVRLTVRGTPLETGHMIYNEPVRFYEQDYPGAEPAPAAQNDLSVEFQRDADSVSEGTDVLFRFSADRAHVVIPDLPEAQERINAVLDDELSRFTEGDPEADGGSGRAFYEGSARAEYTARRTDGSLEWFFPYELDRTMDVARGDSRVLSLTVLDYTFSGGVHGYGALGALNFDLLSGEELHLEDLTDDPEGFLERCGEKLLDISRSGEYAALALGGYFPGYENDVPGLLRDGNWYFDSKGITVIANPYELAPYAAGRIEFTLPYDWLRGQIREEYLPAETGASGSLIGAITDQVPEADSTVDDGTNAQGACVLFRADGPVDEVRITRVSCSEYGGYAENGTLRYFSHLQDGETILLRTWFGDVFPTLKIGWRGSGAQREEFLLFQSGKDGSLVMLPDETAFLPAEISARLPFSADLDCDGEKETLDLASIQTDGMRHRQLTVDGLAAEDTYVTDADILSLWLADLNGDGMTEIIFTGDLGSDDCVTCVWSGETMELVPFTGGTHLGRDGNVPASYANAKAVFSEGRLFLEGWNYQLGAYEAVCPFEYTDGAMVPGDLYGGDTGVWNYLGNRTWLTTEKELPVSWPDGGGTKLAPGTQILLQGADGARAFFITEDGRTGAIDLEYSVDKDGYYAGWNIDGAPESVYFRALPYAG